MRIASVLCLLILCAAPVRAQEEVHFRFAPSDGEVWTRRILTEGSEDPGATAPATSWTSEESYRLRFEKRPDGGWWVHRTLVEGSLSTGGEAAPSAIQRVAAGHPIRLRLDDQGRAEEVEGYRVLMRKLERHLEPAQWSAFRHTVSLDSARQEDRRRWNRVLAGLVGRTARVGEVWSVRDRWVAGEGEVQIFGRLRFDGWTEMEGRRVFKLAFVFRDHPDDLPPLEGAVDRELDLIEEDSLVPREDLDLVGEVLRVVDPATGHLVYEREDFRFARPVARPGSAPVEHHVVTIYRGRPADDEEG